MKLLVKLIGRHNNMNKQRSKVMMILLLVFLLLATYSSISSLAYQINRPENRYVTHTPPHGSNEKATYIDSPIAKVCKVILAGVITISIGFIVFAIYCIRRKLYGRVEVVSLILTLAYWALGEYIISMY